MARKRTRAETPQGKYRRSHPWIRLVEWARRRCKDEASKWYPYYGAKGITCTLTGAQAKELWLRDHADKLRRPSLDRKETDKGYSVDNCRVIEFNDNSKLAIDASFRFLYNDQTPDLPHDGMDGGGSGLPPDEA